MAANKRGSGVEAGAGPACAQPIRHFVSLSFLPKFDILLAIEFAAGYSTFKTASHFGQGNRYAKGVHS
jgi:hypothetical protein